MRWWLGFAALVLAGVAAFSSCGRGDKKGSSGDTEAVAPAPEAAPGPQPPAQPPVTPTAEADSLLPISHGAEVLIRMRRRPFDLAGKTMRLTPSADGYDVELATGASLGDKGALLTDGRTGGHVEFAFERILPFAFPFGGATHTSVFVNSRGSLSFGKADHQLAAARPTFPDGTMTALGMAFDARSRAGLEKLIAVFWAKYEDAKMYVAETSDAVVFTWEGHYFHGLDRAEANGANRDLRVSTFQARLSAAGVIELAWPDVKEDAGIVGVFAGAGAPPELLYESVATIENGAHPSAKIKAFRVYEEASFLRFSYEMEAAVPATEAQGVRTYNVYLRHADGVRHEETVVSGAIGSAISGSCTCRSPAAPYVAVDGRFLDIRMPKGILFGDAQVEVAADFLWRGGPEGTYSKVDVKTLKPLAASSFKRPVTDLSALAGATVGNVYEVFHHHEMILDPVKAMGQAYKAGKRANEDFAVVLTEFPLDSIHNVGGATSALNVPIKNISDRMANPGDTSKEGVTKLQGSFAITWLWNPLYNEVICEGTCWKNHAGALSFFTHELGHRFGVTLDFLHPETRQATHAAYAFGHFHNETDARSIYRVSQHYTMDGSQYDESSVMGGNIWTENADGTWSATYRPYFSVGGFSALEAYVWGVLPPEEVPDSFILEGLKDLGGGKWSGKKVPVKIADVIAAMGGPRDPPAATSQKEFKFRVYVLHEGASARPESLARADRIGQELRTYYQMASGGKITAK